MVKEDIGVLEEPGDHDQRKGDAGETGSWGQGEEDGEDDEDGGSPAAGGAEEVGEDPLSGIYQANTLICRPKKVISKSFHLINRYCLSF